MIDTPSPRSFRITAGALLFSLLVVTAAFSGGAGGSGATGTVEGVVTNGVGDPIPDATVTLTASGSPDAETTTDKGGTYVLEDVPYGDREITVNHDDYEAASRTVSVSTTNSPVTSEFALDRTTGVVTGTVEAENSAPINGVLTGVTVTVEHEDDGDQDLIDGTDLDGTVETDGDGVYLAEVPTGSVTLTLVEDGYEERILEDVTVDADAETTADAGLEAVLVTLDGSVENAAGDAVEGAEVTVTDDTEAWPGLSDDDVNAATDSSGSYAIENVPATTTGGERTIDAVASTFEPETASIAVGAAGATQDFQLQHEGVVLSGTVTDRTETALNGVTVSVEGEGVSVGTDESGAYEVTDLPFGTHTVTVEHPDYRTEHEEIEVRRGEANIEKFSIARETDVRLSIDEVSPDLWQSGDEVSIAYTFDEEVYDAVQITVDGPQTLMDESVPNGGPKRVETFDVPPRKTVSDGTYTVEVSSLGKTETRSVEVSNVYDPDEVAFSEEVYQSPAGDFVEIDVTIGDLDEAYLLIGGDGEADSADVQNYFDVLHVDGDATFVVNTRLVGTDRPSEEVYIPVDGDVESYAHGIGAEAEPRGRFAAVEFQNDRGVSVASTLAEFRTEMGLRARSGPVQADRYRLVAGSTGTVMIRSDGIADFRHPADRSNLVLTPPAVRDVRTYVLPPGPADRLNRFDEGDETLGTGDLGTLLADATERDTVTRGDRLLVEVQATGIFGAMLDDGAPLQTAVTGGDGDGARDDIDADRIATLLDRHEGVRIELADETLDRPNNPGSELRFADVASSDLHVLPDDSADQWDNGEAVGDDPLVGGFYLVIDTRGDGPFDKQPRDGDELSFEVAYESPPGERYRYQDYSVEDGEKPPPFDPAVTVESGLEHFPYFGAGDSTVRANDTFGFAHEVVEYDRTSIDGELIVPSETGTVTGSTNIAPGSDVTVQLIASDRPAPTTIAIDDVDIEPDGSFEVTHDFSALEPGERVEIEFYTPGRLVGNRLLDTRGVRVVEDIDDAATFEVTAIAEDPTVTQGARLESVWGTVENTGAIADRKQVGIDLDGATVTEGVTTLNGGEERRLDLAGEFVVLPPGEYEFTVRTEDDDQTGTLTVVESDETEVTSEADGPTVRGSPADDSDGETEMDSEDDDTDTDDDDGEDDTPTILPFGIGTRETFGGTVLVGATYLLGHWV